jgi:hypothetical protein
MDCLDLGVRLACQESEEVDCLLARLGLRNAGPFRRPNPAKQASEPALVKGEPDIPAGVTVDSPALKKLP